MDVDGCRRRRAGAGTIIAPDRASAISNGRSEGSGARMLRITTRTDADELVMKLEGRLIGPWVRELGACWREAALTLGGRAIRIDLTGVCHVDAEGRELMTQMYRAGAVFLTVGCLMPEVVREISEAAGASNLSGQRS
jgi:hypothetical protein